MDWQVSPTIINIISQYPPHIQSRLLHLRQLIVAVAVDIGDVADVEETLKWGEPSYVRRGGLYHSF